MQLKNQFGEIWGLSWLCVAQIFEEHGGRCHRLRGTRVRVAGLGRKRLEPADCRLRLYFIFVFVLILLVHMRAFFFVHGQRIDNQSITVFHILFLPLALLLFIICYFLLSFLLGFVCPVSVLSLPSSTPLCWYRVCKEGIVKFYGIKQYKSD